MTDTQITIDYINRCENYSKEVGCYNTFDSNCIKEHCFTYRLLQLLKAKEQECEELKKQHQGDKGLITSTGKMNYQLIQEFDKLKTENDKYSFFIEKLCDYTGLECDDEEQAMRTLSDFARQMNKARWIIDRYKQTLTEIKEIAENSCCLQPTSDCEEYKKCNECSRTSDDETVKQIIQKISECEVGNEYNKKDIRHINKNNQEYIAEGNRMTKKIKENECI